MTCSFMETCPLRRRTRVNLRLSLHPLQLLAHLVWTPLLVLDNSLQNHHRPLLCMILGRRIKGNVHQQPRLKKNSISRSLGLVIRCIMSGKMPVTRLPRNSSILGQFDNFLSQRPRTNLKISFLGS